mmetsp:Transcript_100354/g.321781  ORF Transcript_100354/g.321781 Transcript_100354/m.321781 type:complete len:81 (-) Transcript_100354:93-335(-)
MPPFLHGVQKICRCRMEHSNVIHHPETCFLSGASDETRQLQSGIMPVALECGVRCMACEIPMLASVTGNVLANIQPQLLL